jgi:hypothetical protein
VNPKNGHLLSISFRDHWPFGGVRIRRVFVDQHPEDHCVKGDWLGVIVAAVAAVVVLFFFWKDERTWR